MTSTSKPIVNRIFFKYCSSHIEVMHHIPTIFAIKCTFSSGTTASSKVTINYPKWFHNGRCTTDTSTINMPNVFKFTINRCFKCKYLSIIIHTSCTYYTVYLTIFNFFWDKYLSVKISIKVINEFFVFVIHFNFKIPTITRTSLIA